MPVYAAVDIGSHSVRIDVADVNAPARPRLLATERGVARLGESVFRTGKVSPEAMETVCGILRRMAALRAPKMRAVATSALREATNQREFVEKASAALGAPVEIISGEEEARLILLGVRSRLSDAGEKLLILDVGGGSSEIISGGRVWSLPLGALRLQMMFLRHDPPSADELGSLSQFIDLQLAGAAKELIGSHIDNVIGTSATARAVALGGHVTVAEVRDFYRTICALDVEGRRGLRGVGSQRAEIIIPGTAVLLRVLETLHLPALDYSPAGVRDGIIADLSASEI